MEFFILEEDKNYIAPIPSNFYRKLDKKTIDESTYFKFPDHMIFRIEDHMQLVYTDILLFPSFLVSKEAYQVIHLYDPNIFFHRILFFHPESKKSKAYYLPFLESVDCFTKNCEFNLNKSIVFKAEIEEKKLEGKSLVRVAGLNCTCILICLELVESMLRRHLVGIGLREV